MQKTDSSPLFVGLSLTTAALTIGLIVFGAVVRVTDSGLGCGNDWPLCDGRVVPPLDNLTAWVEWLHRLFAMLIGLFGLAMLWAAWRWYSRRNRSVLSATLIAAALFALQSALGALVVVLDLPPTMVTLHLGTAMLLLGALLVAAVISRYRPREHYGRDHVTTLVYMTTALSLIIILTGALVRGSGATLACTDWPLCGGAVLPIEQGRLQTVHMIHRLAVAGLGIALLLVVWGVRRGRQNPAIRRTAVAALAVFLVQAGVGALFVLTEAASVWGAAHVGLASATWGLLIVLCTVETLNNREHKGNSQEHEWNLPPETAKT